MDICTRPEAHIRHNPKVHVGSSSIDELLAGKERLCGGGHVASTEHSRSRELVARNSSHRVPLLIHRGNEREVRGLVQRADEIPNRVDIALKISGEQKESCCRNLVEEFLMNCGVHPGHGDHHEPCKLGTEVHSLDGIIDALLQRIDGLRYRFRLRGLWGHCWLEI